MPGIREALDSSADPIVGVSPLLRAAPIPGPAHILLGAEGIEVSAVGVAHFYAEWMGGFVFDAVDANRKAEIEALGLLTESLDTMMLSAGISEEVARAALRVAARLR